MGRSTAWLVPSMDLGFQRAHGLIGVRAPVALGGPKASRGAGLSGNRTQAVVPHLLCQLPPARHICILDNLFVSNKLMITER